MSDTPKFELDRFNRRRLARGVEAASVKVTWQDGRVEYLWMIKRDIADNLAEWGESNGLRDALEAYKTGNFSDPVAAPDTGTETPGRNSPP